MESISFQIVNWQAFDFDYNDEDDSGQQKYLIKLYGTNAQGESVSVNVLNFTPFFFIKINHSISSLFIQRLKDYIVTKMPHQCRDDFLDAKLLKKKDFWGFQNNEKFNFIRISFTTYNALRAVQRIFQREVQIHGIHNRPIRYKIYEANIEPFIRFMHIKNISPSGWIEIPAKSYMQNYDLLPTTCKHDISCDWKVIQPMEKDMIAPISIASFDIECTSSHGDFPVAKKDYKKVAYEMLQAFNEEKINSDNIVKEVTSILKHDQVGIFSKVFVKDEFNMEFVTTRLQKSVEDIINILKGKLVFKKDKYTPVIKASKDEIMKTLNRKLGTYEDDLWTGFMPKLYGDQIIQIGTTIHKYGEVECSYKNIITLGTCSPISDVDVIECTTEEEVLLKWQNLITQIDPDIITGYNIFGFDFAYMYDRAKELGIHEAFCKIGKVIDKSCPFVEKTLSSSALGDNLLRYIDMDGRVIIDIMKVVQRDHKLDSYKLDNVANHFMKMNKNDVSPNDIFRLFKGNADDRKTIAEYCVQDCALCNKLIMKLEILANNIGMSNVCNVPLSFIFMRGQGVKIFSLVSKQCREDDFCIPTIFKPKVIDGESNGESNDEEGYEGAIVLPPKEGIYLDDPVSVLDYASLYPSSMISENLSHDCIVLDSKYDNLPGVDYLDITYDVYDYVNDKKVKVGEKVCRFVQYPDNEKGVIPRILNKLLQARKNTRKKMEYKTITTKNGDKVSGILHEGESQYTLKKVDGTITIVPNEDVVSIGNTYNEFEKAVLDGLQLAYKVTANSLYGQIGARTSPIYLKEIAACTTATGRKMILMAKQFLEENYLAEIVYGDSVTHDTPLLIRYYDGTIDIKTIQTLCNQWQEYSNFKPWDKTSTNKEQGEFKAQVWTNGKWANINKVIRHKAKKELFRVNTLQGCVDVTQDHSIIDINGNQIKPDECIVGDTEIMHSFPTEYHSHDINIDKFEAWIFGFFFGAGSCFDGSSWSISHSNLQLLEKAEKYLKFIEALDFKILDTLNSSGVYKLVLCSPCNPCIIQKYKTLFYENNDCKKIPTIILNASYNIRLWFMQGYLGTDNLNILNSKETFACKGKIGSQGLYYLMISLGWKNVCINISKNRDDDIYYITSTSQQYYKKLKNKVMEVINLGYSDDEEYVYDIETTEGVFQGGIGSIVCKNTDSIFTIFPNKDKDGNPLKGKEAIMASINTAVEASSKFKKFLKAPHDLEYEKTFYPFILFSKKRYCANKYENDDTKCKMNSMGIALKRRDNAPIVKHIYGGVIDIILNEQDVRKSIDFLQLNLNDLINGKFPLESLVITKSLRADYKDPEKIAHKVLAERMGERDPGNKPMVNDRIPFVYIQCNNKKGEKILQGNRIEHPDYIRKESLKPDYEFYITNQIMKPVLQLYALTLETLDGYKKGNDYFKDIEKKLVIDKNGDMKKVKDRLNDLRETEAQKLLFDPILNKLNNKKVGNREITEFFKIIK